MDLDLDRCRRQRGGCRPMVRCCGYCAAWQQGLHKFRKAGVEQHPTPARTEGQDPEEVPLGGWRLSSDEESLCSSRGWCVLLLISLLYLPAQLELQQGAKHTLFSPADLQSLTQPPREVWCPTMGSLAFRWLEDYIKLKATCRVLHELETRVAWLQRHGLAWLQRHGGREYLCLWLWLAST